MRKDVWDLNLQLNRPHLAVFEPMLSIAPEEFCQLAVSSRPMVRCDDSARGLKGLRDLQTGEFFVVNANDLLAHTLTSV